ncbi:FMN-binding protein [Holdemania filiformis]|uniref:FMN-binding protein n=1 Tax=Holdemania filiformis TaxID=61171 RepID=UPI00242BFA00|nr:FMN-binding protein [Holdemania filiformis]
MKKYKKFITAVFCIVLILIISVSILMFYTVKKAKNLSIITPNMTEISDGEYIGEYSITPVYVKVNVTVKNHKIINIEILQHDNGLGSPAENITDDIIDTQSLEVDAVSGATVSSNCILKAIENAIE